MKNPKAHNTDLQFFTVSEKLPKEKGPLGPGQKEHHLGLGQQTEKTLLTKKEQCGIKPKKEKHSHGKQKKTNDTFNVKLEFN